MSEKRPNILFIMTDDHASHAMSCYGSKINQTPHLDRIAEGGMRFDNCFCTNSICEPSRAAILTGTYNHVNRVTTLGAGLDNSILTFPKLLQRNGYQTAVIGKWHLGHGPKHDPRGFDFWSVLRGQGPYYDPEMIEADGPKKYQGYTTDIITDLCLDWLKDRDKDKPFCLLYHHKAPHREWEPDEKHAKMYEDEDIPEPETLWDDYSNRAKPASEARMRIDRDMRTKDYKMEPPKDLDPVAFKKWAYQRYIKDYLRCVASVDDNVGRVLDYLEEERIDEDTIVVYTSDQGFYLGDHGWYDKRFMYEESLRMPFLIKYPKAIKPGQTNEDIITNVDFATTFLDYAGIDVPQTFQGNSIRPLLEDKAPEDWQDCVYYRYWMHLADHFVCAHYGIRTKRYKLIFYYPDGLNQPGAGIGARLHIDDQVLTVEKDPFTCEWELFDLEKDPKELNNVYNDPAYAEVVRELKDKLHAKQQEVGDDRYPGDVD